MGTFLGHAATGAFLFAYGLWVFLRCQGSRVLWAMRTNDTLLCLPPFAMVLGGFVRTFSSSKHPTPPPPPPTKKKKKKKIDLLWRRVHECHQ
jgi:hypothetical protein